MKALKNNFDLSHHNVNYNCRRLLGVRAYNKIWDGVFCLPPNLTSLSRNPVVRLKVIIAEGMGLEIR